MTDDDPQETAEWLDALDYAIAKGGSKRAAYLLTRLKQRALQRGVRYAGVATTPYVNTISVDQQPEYPGDREIERRIKSIIRWNAMAMVVRANQQSHGIGGHISTYASAATLYEVAFNHFLHGKEGQRAAGSGLLPGPRFAGHLRPGVSAGAADGRAPEELSPRVAGHAGAVVVSASLADAQVLGVSDGVDGAGADHGDLPGSIQPLPGGSGDQARRRHVAGLGFFGRWRMRRAGERSAPSRWPPANNSTI